MHLPFVLLWFFPLVKLTASALWLTLLERPAVKTGPSSQDMCKQQQKCLPANPQGLTLGMPPNPKHFKDYRCTQLLAFVSSVLIYSLRPFFKSGKHLLVGLKQYKIFPSGDIISHPGR